MPIGKIELASAPEQALVDRTIQDLDSKHIEFEKKIHHLRKLRFMKLQNRAPRPFQKVLSGGLRSPLSYRLVQTITGMICKNRPVYDRVELDKDDRDAASRLKSSADPLMQDLERIAHKPLYWHYVDALVADGRSVVKCYRDAWRGFPVQDFDNNEPDESYNKRVAEFIIKGSSHPLRMRQVDNLNFKVPDTDYEPEYVMEGGPRSTLGALQAYGFSLGTNNALVNAPSGQMYHNLELPVGTPATVDVNEIWFDDTVFLRIDGTVFKMENDLGFKPYVWASGETSSHPDVSLQNLSVLYPFAGVEPWLNSMLTILASWSVLSGTPILYTSRKVPPGGGGSVEANPQLSDMPLGKRIDLGMGGEIGFVQPPPVGREVLEYIRFLVEFLDRAGLPEVAYGALGSRTPGTAFQGALEQALSKVNPIVTSAQNMSADIVKMHWRTIETLDTPVVVTGVGIEPKDRFKRKKMGRFAISPRDIKGYYDLHAKITVGNTQDAISKGMHANFMRKAGLWSRDRAMEYVDVQDPLEEYRTIMRDKLEESPFVQQVTLMEALKQEPELAAKAGELEQQGIDILGMLTGVPSGGGAPEGGQGDPGPAQPGSRPAPSGGGRPTGSPKRPGGKRQNSQGSRGHG